MHSAIYGTYGRSHIQYTGATDNISKSNKDNNPSAWLLSVTGSGDDLERIPLST